MKLWLKEQPSPEESFTQYDYEFIKRQLKSYLDPNAEETNTPAAEPSAAVKTDFTLAKAGTGNDKVSKFDDLFNE